MMLALLLAIQTATLPAGDFSRTEVPPAEMIDFLGRRRVCAEQREAYGETSPWLRCADLPAEERNWRRRSAGNATALRWLDLDPAHFRLNSVVVDTWDGAPPARPRRIEQSGVGSQTGQPYHLIVDTEADGGRSTRVTASFANVPVRTFTIDNRAVPEIDPQTVQVMLGTPPSPGGALTVFIRYGDPRGYCNDARDDRPEIQISFASDAVRGYRTDRTNCDMVTTELRDAAAR